MKNLVYFWVASHAIFVVAVKDQKNFLLVVTDIINKALCHIFVFLCKHIGLSYDIYKALTFGHFFEIYSNYKLKIFQNSSLLITIPLINFNPVHKQLLNKRALSNSRLPLYEYSLWNDAVFVCSEKVTVMI